MGHWLESSQEDAYAAVQPDDENDLVKIVCLPSNFSPHIPSISLLNDFRWTYLPALRFLSRYPSFDFIVCPPFSLEFLKIKGGGHIASPHLSSTTGIQIYMVRFDEVDYDSQTQTVDVGAGCLWDGVYIYLKQFNRTVVGGSMTEGVGACKCLQTYRGNVQKKVWFVFRRGWLVLRRWLLAYN